MLNPVQFGAATIQISSQERQSTYRLRGDQLAEVHRQNHPLEGANAGESRYNQAFVETLRSPEIRARLFDLSDRFIVRLKHPEDPGGQASLSVEGGQDFERSYGSMAAVFRAEESVSSSDILSANGVEILNRLLDQTFTKLYGYYDEQAQRPG